MADVDLAIIFYLLHSAHMYMCTGCLMKRHVSLASLNDCQEEYCYLWTEVGGPPSIFLSSLPAKVTELNFVNDPSQLSVSASREFVILRPPRHQEGRASASQ